MYGIHRTGKNSPMYGRRQSEESKRKNSESHIGKGIGKDNPFYGKNHSNETKRKMSENRADFSGKNNPRYKRSKEMYDDIMNGINVNDFVEKYSVSKSMFYSIRKEINN